MAGYTHVCAQCGATLELGDEHLGRRLRCAACRTEFTVTAPGGDSQARPESSPEPQLEALTVPCLACGTLLKIRNEHLGRKLRCPQCGHEFTPDAPAEGPAEPADDRPEAPPEPEQPPEPESQPRPEPAAADQPGLEDRPVPRSYTHVCRACGATLPVHERYYGRTLRCTSCGTEFEADPFGGQVLVDDSLPADRLAERAGGGLRRGAGLWRWIAVAAVVLALAAAVVWWLGGDRRSGFGNQAFRAKKARTDLGVLRNGSEPSVTAALDRETVDEIIDALSDGNPAALDRLRGSSRCIELSAGTSVRVLERRKRGVATRVRVLDGPWSSRIVWVPVQWVE